MEQIIAQEKTAKERELKNMSIMEKEQLKA